MDTEDAQKVAALERQVHTLQKMIAESENRVDQFCNDATDLRHAVYGNNGHEGDIPHMRKSVTDIWTRLDGSIKDHITEHAALNKTCMAEAKNIASVSGWVKGLVAINIIAIVTALLLKA